MSGVCLNLHQLSSAGPNVASSQGKPSSARIDDLQLSKVFFQESAFFENSGVLGIGDTIWLPDDAGDWHEYPAGTLRDFSGNVYSLDFLQGMKEASRRDLEISDRWLKGLRITPRDWVKLLRSAARPAWELEQKMWDLEYSTSLKTLIDLRFEHPPAPNFLSLHLTDFKP